MGTFVVAFCRISLVLALIALSDAAPLESNRTRSQASSGLRFQDGNDLYSLVNPYHTNKLHEGCDDFKVKIPGTGECAPQGESLLSQLELY